MNKSLKAMVGAMYCILVAGGLLLAWLPIPAPVQKEPVITEEPKQECKECTNCGCMYGYPCTCE